MSSFNYDRYSSKPISDPYPRIDVRYLQNACNDDVVITINDLFNEYITSVEKQRGYKCSRQERRKLHKQFLKNNKR